MNAKKTWNEGQSFYKILSIYIFFFLVSFATQAKKHGLFLMVKKYV